MGDSSSATGARPLHDSAPVELTAKILMTAAIVLFLVVIFVLVLHLYAKWFWGRVDESSPSAAQQNPNRRRRNHRRRRHFVFAAAGSHDPSRKGLDPAILRSLPVLTFGPGDTEDELECAICLSGLTIGEKARLLPKCNHGFHSDCIDMWFESHSTCPICRNPVGCDSSKSAETDPEDNSGSDSSTGATELVEESASNGQTSESPNFPTNVLFWGNDTQVSSRSCLEEVPSSSSSSTPLNSITAVSAGTSNSLVIDIPRPIMEEEPKSPVTTRLRSLKRLLSRDRRIKPCSSSSADAEQV